MGFNHVNWVRDLRGINTQEKAVLYALALRVPNEGPLVCWPSHKKIALDAGYSEGSASSVKRVLKSLAAKCLISWIERRDDDGQTSNLYTVHHGRTVGELDDDLPTPPGSFEPTPPDLNEPTPQTQASLRRNHLNKPDEETTLSPPEQVPGQRKSCTPEQVPGHPSAHAQQRQGPISAEFEASKHRQQMIQAIREAAGRDDNDYAYEDDNHPLGKLADLLTEALDGEDILSWAMGDMGWTVPKKATHPYEAGIWLNKLLNWWQVNQSQLTYAGEQK